MARGVFDSLDEADLVLCEWEEARSEPRLRFSAFGRCRDVSSAGFPSPTSLAPEPAKPFSPSARVAVVSRVAKPGHSAGPVTGKTAETAGNSFAGRMAGDASPVSTSQRSPELSIGAAVMCPWCALERAMNGQGSAPRTGFVSVQRCERHAAEIPLPEHKAGTSTPTPAPANAHSLASGAGLPINPNPNAGQVQAFPKGRW